MAQPYRSRVSLLDATAADTARLVCRAAAELAPYRWNSGYLDHRDRECVSNLPAASAWRAVAAYCVLLLAIIDCADRNYNFFNLLTMLLCIFLFDDAALRRVVPVWLGIAGGKPVRRSRVARL